ncbi:MAG: peptidylprolyl isomerase [Gammaproteobacteria bacterium]|nr:peptidylprolyl isomerase [Gammaproteobacteria bacterium]
MKLLSTALFSLIALCFGVSVLAGNPQVKLETVHGHIIIELDRQAAPISVDNFLSYVSSGYYNGTIFHRVIPGFMVQGGGFGVNEKAKAGTQAPIMNEAINGLSNQRGTISMARTSNPHSATAQFFINHQDNLFLDKSTTSAGYAVFGRVIEGMNVVDRIAEVPTQTKRGHQNWPREPVYLYKAYSLTQ